MRSMRAHMGENRATLRTLAATFVHFRLTLSEHEQKMDDLTQRLGQAIARIQARRRGDIERLHRRLAARHPRAVIAASRASLGPLEVRLSGAAKVRVDALRSRLSDRRSRLSALSPLAVLARGYAIATTTDGRAIRLASEVAEGDEVSIRVHRGAFSAKVVDVKDTGETDSNIDSVLEEER
jgi:exodeoxyribonuclease VII large subunit